MVEPFSLTGRCLGFDCAIVTDPPSRPSIVLDALRNQEGLCTGAVRAAAHVSFYRCVCVRGLRFRVGYTVRATRPIATILDVRTPPAPERTLFELAARIMPLLHRAAGTAPARGVAYDESQAIPSRDTDPGRNSCLRSSSLETVGLLA